MTIQPDTFTDIGSFAINPNRAKLAYYELAAKIAAVPEEDFVPLNFDAPTMIGTVFATADRLASLIPQMADLPGFDVEPILDLEKYGIAAFYTYLIDQRPSVPQALIVEAAKLKKDLLISAEPLVHYGYADADRVAAIRAGSGHIDTANDLVELAMLYGEIWEQVKNQTSVTIAMVDRADELGLELLKHLAVRRAEEHPLGPNTSTKRTRNQAFTLLIQVYEQARRAVAFLRWEEGDVDVIVPSIYTRTRRASAAVEEVETEEVIAPSEPSTTPNTEAAS